MSFLVNVELLNELFVEYQRSSRYMPGKMPSFGVFVSNYSLAQNNNNLDVVPVVDIVSALDQNPPPSALVSTLEKKDAALIKQESVHSDSKRKLVDISDDERDEERKTKKNKVFDKQFEIDIHFVGPEKAKKLADSRQQKSLAYQRNVDTSSVVKRVAKFINSGDVKEFSLRTSPEETFAMSRLLASENYALAKVVDEVENLIDKNHLRQELSLHPLPDVSIFSQIVN